MTPAQAAYELDAFKPNLTRTEADKRIAMLTAKLKLLTSRRIHSETGAAGESTSTKCSTRMCLGSSLGPQSISINVSGLATISSGLRSAATPQRHATAPPSTISSEPSK